MEVREKASKLDDMVKLFKEMAYEEIQNGGVDAKMLALTDTGDAIGGPIPSRMCPSSMLTTLANSFFKEFKAQAAVFSSEAWMLQTKSREEVDAFAGRVNEHPDKIECVIIIAGFEGYIEFHSMKIIREKDQPPKLEEFVSETHEDIQTVFAKCFEGVFNYPKSEMPEDTIGKTIGTA